VPFVRSVLPPDHRIGVITANSTKLTEEHFLACGWSSDSAGVDVVGVQGSSFCADNIALAVNDAGARSLVADAMKSAAGELLAKAPRLGAVVLECTNMPPYAEDVQQVTGVPVFDVITMTEFLYASTRRRAWPRR
jgi:hypothetical protein